MPKQQNLNSQSSVFKSKCITTILYSADCEQPIRGQFEFVFSRNVLTIVALGIGHLGEPCLGCHLLEGTKSLSGNTKIAANSWPEHLAHIEL